MGAFGAESVFGTDVVGVNYDAHDLPGTKCTACTGGFVSRSSFCVENVTCRVQ